MIIGSYFDWLKTQVEYFDAQGEHERLFDALHSHQYVALIPLDENRIDDAMALRDEYCGHYASEADMIIDGPCSFFEFLVAVARRMNYIYADLHENCTQDLFWEILHNIDLDAMADEVYDDLGGDAKVEEAVTRVVQRAYGSEGEGNLFPIPGSKHNQRNVEVWYQFNQYISYKVKMEGR